MNAMKKAVKPIVFLVILALVAFHAYSVLRWKDTAGIDGLYRNDENSVDVLFIGSSHSFCTVNTAVLWQEYGIAADDIGENGQTVTTDYYYMKEALKTQKPTVIFIELWGIERGYNETDGNIYRNTVNMNWSTNYFENMNGVLDGLQLEYQRSEQDEEIDEEAQEEEDKTDTIRIEEDKTDNIRKGIVLKFPVVHTRYDEITESDYNPGTKLLRYRPNWTVREYDIPESCSETGIEPLSDQQIEYLESIVALSKQHDVQLVFWVAPFVASIEQARRFNAVEEFAREHGIAFYNFLKMTEETGFDFSTDMRKERYNGSHMNVDGAMKITNYLGQMLKEDYGLPDHRGDSRYSRYDQIAREWEVACATHALDAAENLQDYVAALDHSLFEATVIDFGFPVDDAPDDDESDEGSPQTEEIDGRNLIVNPQSYTGWFVAKKDYVFHPERGVVEFSASGLTEVSYTRVEGPVSLETEALMNGDDFVLSFEVMSPDWSAVNEPTTDYTGLDAVAVTFVTADDSPTGKQLAYRFARLGKTQSTFWREVPDEVDGEWLRYVSVPLRFTPKEETWAWFDRGIGKYMRVGPSLRANGTVYFRNFRLEKCNETNDWAATMRFMLQPVNDTQSGVPGLYTDSSRNRINGAWELSDLVKLIVDEEDLQKTKLYNGSKQVKINKCNACIIVVDKETGKLIKKSEFALSGGVLMKQ